MSAWQAVLALALSLAAGSAVAVPPQVNLRVEVRSVPASAPPVAGAGFAVGTRSGPPATPGETRLRTGPGGDGDGDARQVLVRNGGSASLHLDRWQALATGDWAWGGADAGVGQMRQWIDAGRGLRVHPRWPGGTAPVALEIGAEDAHHLALQTTLILVPGRWVDIARSADAVLQVRVLPER